MRSKTFISQALASLKNDFLPSFYSQKNLLARPIETVEKQPHRTERNRKFVTGMALSLALISSGLTSGWASAKTVQVEGVRYQPEGLVIQLAGGKVKAPGIETWPNMKDGVKTELIIIRIPNCDGNYEAMQQAATQELGSHPEIKQFWVTPLDTDKTTAQGLQIALEVVTTPSKPEFTPEALSQGDDQWVITLQSVASKLSDRPLLPEKINKIDSTANATDTDNAQQPVRRARKNRAEETATRDSVQQPSESTQNLVAALNQARQKQAELGAQVVTLQQSLAQSNAEKDTLKSRLESYESLIETTGANPDMQKEDQAVIQNLKNALVKVAQKLKATEAELAKQQGRPSERSSQPLKNLVHREKIQTPETPAEATQTQETQEDGTPVAAMGMLGFDENASRTQGAGSAITPKKIANASLATINVYHAATPAASAKPEPKTEHPAENTEARLKQAIRRNPIQVDHYLNLADFYVAKKDWKNAQATLTSLTQVEPGGAQGYYYLAMIYLSQKERTHAQTALWQYAKRNPKDVKGIQTLKKALQANTPVSNSPASGATGPAANATLKTTLKTPSKTTPKAPVKTASAKTEKN